MTWTIRLGIGFVVIGSFMLCNATRFDDFLEEKQASLQEVDRLFYTFYFNNASQQQSSGTNIDAQLQVFPSNPLPSPDWSTHSPSFTMVPEEDTDEDLDESHSILFEEENYRPREEASGRVVWVGDREDRSEEEEDVSSGDSGVFLTDKPGDDDEGYEYLGSGDSRMKETTSRQTTSVLQETTTSIPVEPNDAVQVRCGACWKLEINSCVELSLNVRTLLHLMEHLVDQSGYYNVTSNYYFLNLLRTCFSGIVTPPSCIAADDGNDNVIREITEGVIAFVSDNRDANADYRTFEWNDCFNTHLQLLSDCLGERLTNTQLENLVKTVIARAKDVSVQECFDLKEVQQCVVGSIRCEDTSVEGVGGMFEATAREITTCSVDTTKSVNDAALKTSLGTVVTLALSILMTKLS